MPKSRAASHLDPWFLSELVCPRDHGDLRLEGTELACESDHRYPVLDGVPVMLFVDETTTMPKAFGRSLSLARGEGVALAPAAGDEPVVDPWVQENITMICGKHFYGRLTGRLGGYPIPHIHLPRATRPGQEMLDIGCNWGRWSVAAGRLGYFPIGIDPMLEAVLAARRVARQLGVQGRFLVGDARHLPFRPGRFETVHSYGVFQHFSKPNARLAIEEAGRVLGPGGTSLIQMTAAYGPLALMRRARYSAQHGREDPGGFEVRHWSPREMRRFFGSAIGPTAISVDSYFTINPHPGELMGSLAFRHRVLLRLSDLLAELSTVLPPLVWAADSLYATSVKPGVPGTRSDAGATATLGSSQSSPARAAVRTAAG